MTLSANKRDTIFSNDSQEAYWTASLTLNGCVMPCNQTPRFLGIRFDRILTLYGIMDTLKPQSNGPLYISTMTGTLAVDG